MFGGKWSGHEPIQPGGFWGYPMFRQSRVKMVIELSPANTMIQAEVGISPVNTVF